MSAEYVDITPELLGKPDPDQQWIERELDRINPWRHEQGADGADTAALRQLVLELRQQRNDAVKALEASENFCLGMRLDPAVPRHAKDALNSRAHAIRVVLDAIGDAA